MAKELEPYANGFTGCWNGRIGWNAFLFVEQVMEDGVQHGYG